MSLDSLALDWWCGTSRVMHATATSLEVRRQPCGEARGNTGIAAPGTAVVSSVHLDFRPLRLGGCLFIRGVHDRSRKI